jgi:hypothetical protein
MCLYTLHDRPKIAKKDMKVYKRLHYRDKTDKCMAPFQTGFRYTSFKTYPKVLFEEGLDGFRTVIGEGYHAYRTFKYAWKDNLWALGVRTFAISQDVLRNIIVEMIIPEGTRYFNGENGEIVAEQIRTEQLEELVME